MLKMVKRISSIVACGGIGAVAGWRLAQALEMSGLTAALLATGVAVVVAAGLWVGAVAIHDRVRG